MPGPELIDAALSERGWAELRAARWQAAGAAFRAAVEREPTAEAFEGLSWAAWWLDDAATVFEARQRAFQLYRRRGDREGAARVAVWLAADELDFHGAFAVAAGWLRRAHRLLRPLEPGPVHGWLAFHEGYVALSRSDTARAMELADRAAELGRHCDVADLEMLGLALRGAVLVACAEVGEGMACLDEATVMALGSEATIPISRAWTCCFLVTACEAVRDYARAFEWCDRIAEFCERYDSRYMLGFCRAHYGAVHVWRGRWQEAEAALTAAIDAYAGARPAFVPAVRIELAELRRRQGRFDEAERLVGGAGAAALSLRARLALDRGEPRQAAELAQRALRRIPAAMRLQRASAVEVLASASAARGELVEAAAAVDELTGIAGAGGTAPLQAAADLAGGVLASASGDLELARRRLEDAVDGFERSGAPFEAAVARAELAICLGRLGRSEAAAREAATSHESLAALGAAAEARRAHDLVESATPSAATAADRSVTRREREVLGLVAAGLTNRQIAERLVLSEHTVHRHIANILRKLQLPSRSAAAAHAVRAGLLDDGA